MSDSADKTGVPPTKQLRVTLRDVAKKLGVSHVTVSLALRNHPSIPASRRAEVRQMAEQMGYRPDPLLSSLAVYRTQNRPSQIKSALCWLNHWEQPERLRSYGEFDAYWRGALVAAERFGYHLDDLRWTPEFTAERFEQILLTRGVRGVLIPPHQSPPDWGKFDWNKFSVIRFGLSVPYPDSHLVTSDQQRAAIMALKKISSYGYERIGMVVEEHLDTNIGGNYTGGFHAARELFKLHGVASMIVLKEHDTATSTSKAKTALARWLAKVKPDAILTTDRRVPQFLEELGYRIPKDIAVAGTSVTDIPVAAGINQNGEEVGRTAVEMLVAQININQRGAPAAPCRILVESFWQDGKSLPPRRG